jgi:cobalt-zinc-cadmium efflux system outer membrane protein
MLCAASLAIAPMSLLADSGLQKNVTLDSLFEQALLKSPVLSDIRAKIEGQRGLGITTSTLENPVLDAELRKPRSYDGGRGDDEIALSLSQPLRASDFGSRAKVGQLMQNLTDLDAKTELMLFKQKLKLAYVRCWALERRQRELKHYEVSAAHIEKSVERANQAGLLGKGEALLFTTEIKRARLELEALGSEATRARAELVRMVGDAIGGALEVPSIAVPDVHLSANSEFQVPAQARAKIIMNLAAEQQRQARLDAFPKFAPRIVFERSNDGREYVGLGISLDLPVFNRNQGERMTRQSEVDSAKTWSRYIASPEFEEEMNAIAAHVRASTKLVRGYEDDIVPAIKSALEIEMRSFDEGNGSPTRVWQALKELAAVQTEVLERFAKLHSDSIELTILTGQEF